MKLAGNTNETAVRDRKLAVNTNEAGVADRDARTKLSSNTSESIVCD